MQRPHAAPIPSGTQPDSARLRTPASVALVLALCLAGASLAPVGCASKPRPSTGEVLRMDEIAQREREAYDLARKASAAQQAGKIDEATDLYRQALNVWPEIPSAWNNLGLLLMDQNNYMDAVDAFKTAARQDPSDPRPLINVGVAYDRTGWAEEALTAYSQALERRPNDRDALLGAILANHRLLGADRPALDRVRTALMLEQDADTRAWLERERFRIEGRIQTQRRDSDVAIPPPSRATSTPAGSPAPVVVPLSPN